MMNEIDYDNFVDIGSRIRDGIYEIPKEDLEFFYETKRTIQHWKKRAELLDNIEKSGQRIGELMQEAGIKL